MIDEGYIKYESHWTPGPATHIGAARELETWRKPLYDAGLIGEYKDIGIGYGNISLRRGSGGLFLITGTQTGHLRETNERHYSLVTDCDIRSGIVRCSGPIQASSEAMTHAVIYNLEARIGAVVHAHSPALWRKYQGDLPTTDPNVPYGTPEMAAEFDRLYRMGGFKEAGVAVMGGHEDGLVSFGSTLQTAAERLLALVLPGEPGPA